MRVVYTVPEVAALLGISDSLAYRLIERGDIPALRLGQRRIVVPKVAIERLCESAAPSKAAS